MNRFLHKKLTLIILVILIFAGGIFLGFNLKG